MPLSPELQAAFDAELTRLLAKGLSPEEETLARRYYSDKERDSMDSDQFCGPHQSFPIKSQEDITNAASLAGHADNPDAVRACIRRKAKANGWKLPDSWEEGEHAEERAAHPDEQHTHEPTTLARAADGNHDPFTGTHSHSHPAFGAQGDDETHEHEHSHDGDNDHKHGHSDKKTEDSQDRQSPQAFTPEQFSVYLPITRVDEAPRTVTGQATCEKPDAYGTIFGYYPEAWLKWRGNMREQHDPRKAVGKAIEVTPDPEERAIYVTSKVSRGAQDTWLKIEDGVLTGYSASIIPDPEFGNDPKKWPKKEYNGKEYPYLPRYQVAETSYVDNPATPGCDIVMVRADGFVTDVIDVTEEVPEPATEKPLERAGARVSGATKGKMHESIGHTLRAAASQMQNCNCDDCAAAMKLIDPDGDGDVDLGGFDDPDGDWQSLYNKQSEDMERVVTDLINRALTPAYARLQGIAGTLARNNALPANLDSMITSAITRAFESIDSKLGTLPSQASFDEVRADLSAVRDQVAKIAEQPMPGGPILNASTLPLRPVEKQLPTDPPLGTHPQRASYGAVYDAIAQLSRQGALDTQDKQVDAMTAALIAQRRR
jgi:hypothetical protein